MRSKSLLLITVAVIITRIPFLSTGYGTDGDAWRVAHVGHALWTTGSYEISRPPGYPAHEMLSAPLVALGGSALSNAVTLVASIIAVIAWYAFLQGRTQRPGALTVAFAFAPLFWMNSATTMDYVWSLLMILLAMHAIIRMRLVGAGILAGFAIGFRPSNAVLLLPLAILLMTVTRKRAVSIGPVDGQPGNDETRPSLVPLLIFLVSSFITVVALFLPVVFTYGIGGWLRELGGQFGANALGISDALLFFFYRTAYAIGPLAVLSVFWIILRKGAFSAAWNSRDHLFVPSLVSLGVLLLVFALFPLEKSYLLPGLPFLILILDKLATPRAFSLFAVLLISFAFVNPDIVQHGGVRGSPGFNVHTGMVIEEWQKRKELEEWRKQLASTAFPERTVIMTGAGPAFWFENDGVEPVLGTIVRNVNDVVVQQKGNPAVLFVPMIPREETERLERLGWLVMCDARNRDYIQHTMGYRIDTFPGETKK